MVVLLLLLPLFMIPDVSLTVRPLDDSVQVSVAGVRSDFNSCVDAGFEATLRYHVRMCRTRTWWFNSCKDYRYETRSARFDPVSETYEVESDRYGDDLPRLVSSRSSKDEAFDYVVRTPPWSSAFLSRDDERVLSRERGYFSVRVVGDCRGQSSDTMLLVSSVLTLGLVTVNVFDTNWIDFPRPPEAGRNP